MSHACSSWTSLAPETRNYLAAQALSVTFSWATRFAVAWWVYRLSHSSWTLGLAAFLGQGFSLFVIPFAGELADRIGRRRLYLATQMASTLQVGALSMLAFCGCEDLRVLLGFCAVRGIIFAFEQPARDGLMGDLARDRNRNELVVLQATVVQLGRLAGPAIAGILIRLAGEESCFILDCLSYLPVILALCRLSEAPVCQHPDVTSTSWWKKLSSGSKIVCRAQACERAVLLLACLSFLGLPLLTVLPSFARDALGGGPVLLSSLIFASSLGAIIGNYVVAKFRREDELEMLVFPAFLATGFALMLISIASRGSVAAIGMFLSGLAAMMQISGTNILLQSRCGTGERGRVMAVYGAAFWGVAPFGSLLIGKVAAAVGIRSCLFFYGLCCLVIGQLVFLFAYAVIPWLGRSRWPPVTGLEESRYAGL